jgi:hypothetical protein
MSQFAFVVDGTPVAAVNIADADKDRIMAAYATLPGYSDAADNEPAMWQAIAGGWLQGTLANVQRIEEDEQRRAVQVQPIQFEPVRAPEPEPFEPSAHTDDSQEFEPSAHTDDSQQEEPPQRRRRR